MRLFFSSIALIMFLIGIVSCSRNEYVITDLGIDKIDIFISESKPGYVIVMVHGSVPNGCYSLHETQHWVEANTINIKITTKEALYATCTDLVEEFQIPVYIGQWDAIGVYIEYEINVNGVTKVFRIKGDAILIIR